MVIGHAHRQDGPFLVHLTDHFLVGERVVRIAPRRGVVEIENRLGNAEEQQADTHTCRKQHGKPGEVAEFRFAVVVTQLDVPEFAEHQVQADEQHDHQGADVVPVERRFDSTSNGRINVVREFDVQGREDDERGDHALGRDAHGRVQPLSHAFFGNMF